MREGRSKVQRQDDRFPIDKFAGLQVTIGRNGGEELVSAEPVDISERGMKLRVNTPFKFEESITVLVGQNEGQLRMAHSGRVSWLRQESADTWLLGCQFEPKLPPHALEEMFSTGVLERRRFPRYPVGGQGVAHWELQAERFTVWLVDISEGGFCMCCQEPGQIGQRMRINLDSPTGPLSIQGKAQWCAPLDNAFLIGLAFLDPLGFVTLRSALTVLGPPLKS